jgi:hypothetical protein
LNYKFLVADLASIETRVAAWLSGCESLEKVFRDGLDAYLDLAVKMYGLPYGKLWADYKGENGKAAQIAASKCVKSLNPEFSGVYTV